jgi:serine/threonine protein phosphatase PrpC
LPNNDSPGLAMARAFGDFCLKDYGLISVPEISYHRLTEKDEFIILATDGVSSVSSYISFKMVPQSGDFACQHSSSYLIPRD